MADKVQEKKDSKLRKVKVFGERNTGTRAVMSMLRGIEGVTPKTPGLYAPDLDLLDQRVEETIWGFHRDLYRDAILDERNKRQAGVCAWKHAAPVVDDSYAAHEASVLFLVRDPYSWIRSFIRRPHHSRAPRVASVVEFIQRPWMCVHRDNLAQVLMSPMDLWNEKLRAYIKFSEAAPVPSTVLHFERFVVDPVEALRGALAEFGIASDGLREIERSTKKYGKTGEERRAFYKSGEWKKELSLEAAELVNTYVDWEVAAHFGYKMQNPEDFGCA